MDHYNYVYISQLNEFTCTPCASSHGGIFTAETAPTLPRHHHCRCRLQQVPADVWQPGHVD